MKKLLWLLLLSVPVTPAAFADGALGVGFTVAAASTAIPNIGTGISFHKLTWNVSGTVATCTVALDTSVDSISWSAGGAIVGQTCTSNGASAVVNVVANYVRINVTVFSGTGSVNVTWNGYVNNATSLPTGTTVSGSDITFPGAVTVKGQFNCKSIGNAKCVDESNTQGWTGTDIGGWINSAYTSCLPGTCAITVYSLTGNRVDYSTPIVASTLSKNLILICASPSNGSGTGGLVLNYTPTTATAALTIDNALLSGIAWIPQEIRGCTFVNNQIFTQGGGGSLANGIASGTVNGGIGWLKLIDSAILGFGNDILIQNSTGGWGVDCDNSTLGDATIGLSITANQEVFHLTKCRMMSNGRGIKSTASGDIVAAQSQFDSNTVWAVDLSGATGGMFSSPGNHFENFNTSNCNYVTSAINNYFSGGTVLNDNTTSNCTNEFVFTGATSTVIDGVAISTAGQTATNVFNIGDPACSQFVIQNNTPSVFTTLASVIGGSTTCAPVGTVINKGASNQKNPYYFSDGAQGAPGMAFFADPLTGFARVAAGTTQYVSAGSDGALQTNIEIREGNLARYTWSSAADALSAVADTGLSRDAAGVVDVGTGAQGNKAGTVNLATLTATNQIQLVGSVGNVTVLPAGNELDFSRTSVNNIKVTGVGGSLALFTNGSASASLTLNTTGATVLGTAGALSGTLFQNGATSGSTSLTPPAAAGTVTNPLASSNNLAAPGFYTSNGTACTNGELALSAGWQSTGSATVTAAAGVGQTCMWTITTGTTVAANPTITDTLVNPLSAATIVCEMNIHGGTGVAAYATDGPILQTSLSATAPIFTFQGTPAAAGATYFITRRCGP